MFIVLYLRVESRRQGSGVRVARPLLTSPEMREAPGAQNGQELRLHLVRVSVARVGKFLPGPRMTKKVLFYYTFKRG